MALAHGRASAKVISDIGAGVPGRWHDWQERCKIGSTSFENVGPPAALGAGVCLSAEAPGAKVDAVGCAEHSSVAAKIALEAPSSRETVTMEAS
jgi:hypothetical protein